MKGPSEATEATEVMLRCRRVAGVDSGRPRDQQPKRFLQLPDLGKGDNTQRHRLEDVALSTLCRAPHPECALTDTDHVIRGKHCTCAATSRSPAKASSAGSS
jgi:hypothetical protein